MMITDERNQTNSQSYCRDGIRTVLYVDHTARWSGGEISLTRLLYALDRTAFRPVVALGEEGPLADRLREIGIETHILPLDEEIRDTRKDTLSLGGITRNLIRSGPAVLSYARRITALAKECDARLIHCNSLKSDIYGAIAGRLSRRPVIWHIRDFIAPPYLPSTTVTAFRNAARILPTHILTNSQATLTCLFPKERDRCHATVIHNGLTPHDLLYNEPPTVNSWAGKKEIRIGLIGRLARWKGQHILIEAALRLDQERRAGRLPADLPPVRFLIVGGALFGETEYEREIKQQAEPAGETIQWAGMVQDIPALLRSLDLLVHTSITPEPFGQVVIEGMAAGLPIIATAGGGIPEIIKEGQTGILVPMGDAEALSQAIRSLLLEPTLANRLGRSGYTEVRTRFTARHMAAAVEAVYDRIASGTIGGASEGRFSLQALA